MDFKNKIVLITGASRGIGFVTGYEFARYGAEVVINYNTSYEEALILQKKIKKDFKRDTYLVKADISDEESVRNMVDSVISKYGKIDILVNNAGICNDSLFDEKKAEDFNKVLAVNVTGTYLVSKYVGRHMLKKRSGKIINIASDNVYFSYYPESAEYDASKAGVISLTHNMARFYAPEINVNCVCPGWIHTDMNSALTDVQRARINSKILKKRFGAAEEVAKVILFLASDLASYVNDSIVVVNGGYNNE